LTWLLFEETCVSNRSPLDIQQNIASLTDEELLKHITTSGDNRMIAELYRRYSAKIYRRSVSLVKEQSTAEDLTHDIFMKILHSLSSFRGNSKVSTWIYAISYNFCIDHLRKTKKARFNQNDYEAYASDELVDYVDDLEDIKHIRVERLKEMLGLIHVEDKMILLMKYQDGMSIRNIQQILSISESAAKMRIKRAKEKVKKAYLAKYKYYE